MELSLSIANSRLLNPGEVILVSSKIENKTNIITVAWQTPLSHNPPLVGISIGKTRYSHKIVRLSKEFVINIPTVDLFPQVIKCGTTSGKDVDKFELTKLTPINSKKLQTPKIKECIGWLECKLVNSVECGDHTLFVGEVIHAEVEQSFFKNKYWNISQTKLIHHLGGNFFISSSDKQINGL